jgi:hypothetical protein
MPLVGVSNGRLCAGGRGIGIGRHGGGRGAGLPDFGWRWRGAACALGFLLEHGESLEVSADHAAVHVVGVFAAEAVVFVVVDLAGLEAFVVEPALAAEVDSRVRELTPRSRAAGPQALVLAAIALAHELEIERKKRQELEGRTRDALTRMLGRIDLAMGEGRSAELMS